MNIVEIDLNLSISANRVGVVTMHSKAQLSVIEPFKWSSTKKSAQIEKVKRTLQISKTKDHEADVTNFTIFPEYSVPHLEGVSEIDQTVRAADWPVNSIVIAGLDGLTKAEYSTMVSRSGTTVINGSEPASIAQGKWVNCFIMWVKELNGDVKQFVQTKLAPAWPEQNIQCEQMHCGSSVFLFNTRFDNNQKCSFLSLICFDWIGKTSLQEPIWASVLQSICNKYTTNRLELNWIFVLQENRKPSHPEFLTVAKQFFVERSQFPAVNRDNCVIVFSNNAGSDSPAECETHGDSSLVFSPQASAFQVKDSPLTYSGNPVAVRGTEILSSCSDVIFREKGSCIHSFSMRPPSFLPVGGSNKCIPLVRANVHSIDGVSLDPRVPGVPVTGVVKWVNDKIEKTSPLGQRVDSQISEASKPVFESSAKTLANHESSSLSQKMNFASARELKGFSDKWQIDENDALKTLLDTVTIFGMSFPTDFSVTETHALVKIDEEDCSLVSVTGNTHINCRKHVDTLFIKPAREKLIVVTRNKENSAMTGRDHKFTNRSQETESKGRVLTDPESGVVHVDYASVLNSFTAATDVSELKVRVDELLK